MPNPRIIHFDGRRLVKLGNIRINYRQAQALRAMGRAAFVLLAPATIELCRGNEWAETWQLSPRKRAAILSARDFIMKFAEGKED